MPPPIAAFAQIAKAAYSLVKTARSFQKMVNNLAQQKTPHLTLKLDFVIVDYHKSVEKAYWKAERKLMMSVGGLLRKSMRGSIKRRGFRGESPVQKLFAINKQYSKVPISAAKAALRRKRSKQIRQLAKRIRKQTSKPSNPAYAHAPGGSGLKRVKFDYKKNMPLIVGPVKYDATGKKVPRTLERGGHQKARFLHLKVMENDDPSKPRKYLSTRSVQIDSRPNAALTLDKHTDTILRDFQQLGMLMQAMHNPVVLSSFLNRPSGRGGKRYISA